LLQQTTTAVAIDLTRSEGLPAQSHSSPGVLFNQFLFFHGPL